MDLGEFFAKNTRAAVAFSGGADSSYLLYAAKKAGADVTAYYAKTEFQPQFEYRDALRVCDELQIKMKVLELNILQDDTVASNPENRCYHCKKTLFTAIARAAAADGYSLVIDGTNASDDANDRPGMKALFELHVCSPLRECGLTKDKIRSLSKTAGLFTWNKPAYACLATRIPYGDKITSELLCKIESAEDELFALEFSDFRVRVLSGAARLQIPGEQFSSAAQKRAEIAARIKPYFETILLDMEAR